MIKGFKSQKGAISLFAVLSIMFFIAFMIGAYRIVSANNSQQITSLTDIQERYQKDEDTIKGEYNAVVSNSKEIPISSYKEFAKMGSGNYVVHDGIVYLYGGKGYTYKFTNDIVFDLDKEVDDNNQFLTAKANFVPPSIVLEEHLNPTDENYYKINPNGYDIVYYKNNEKYKLLVYYDAGAAAITTTADAFSKNANGYSYSKLTTYKNNLADANASKKYTTRDSGTTIDLNHYLLLYNIPNKAALTAIPGAGSAVTALGTLGFQNGGFLPQAIYTKWSQKKTATASYTSFFFPYTAANITGVDIGFKDRTEGAGSLSTTVVAIPQTTIRINPSILTKAYFVTTKASPTTTEQTTIAQNTFMGLCQKSTNGYLLNKGTSTSVLKYLIGNSSTSNVTVDGVSKKMFKVTERVDASTKTNIYATKAMLLVKIFN